MKTTLIKDLKEQDVMAVLRKRMLANEFLWPRLMPAKFNPTLTWKNIESDIGIPVAADVVAFDSAAPIKKREVVSRLTGDIPKIEMMKVKSERDINDYNELLHYAGTDAGRRELIRWWADDVAAVTDGVNARLEWLMLQALSLGKISLSSTNNPGGIVTENVVDFLVPSGQKGGATVVWSSANAATSKPWTKIKAIVKAAKARGVKYAYMLMDEDTFDAFAIADEVQKMCATWVVQATSLETLPTVDSANKALKASGLPEIVIIDSLVTIEDKAGTRTTANPWTTGVVTFLPDLVCGNVYHAPLADEIIEDPATLKVKNGHIMVKKWGQNNPSREFTSGAANAFPVWASAQQAYLLYTLDTSWSL